jgi:hypothetical protein
MLPADLSVGSLFTMVLHSRKCVEGGGAVFQDPSVCPHDGGFTEGCTADTVAAHTGPTALEMRIEAPLDEYIADTGKKLHRVRKGEGGGRAGAGAGGAACRVLQRLPRLTGWEVGASTKMVAS